MRLQALLKQLLSEAALQTPTIQTATPLANAVQIRFLILKNLAANLSNEDSTCEEALRLYVEATELDSTDVVLWHRMGALVGWSVLRLSQENALSQALAY